MDNLNSVEKAGLIKAILDLAKLVESLKKEIIQLKKRVQILENA